MDYSDDDFDKKFNRMAWLVGVSWLTVIAGSLGVVVFVMWVIVKLLAHFGVI